MRPCASVAGHALDAVHAALVAQPPEHRLARHPEHRFLQPAQFRRAGIHRLDLEPDTLRRSACTSGAGRPRKAPPRCRRCRRGFPRWRRGPRWGRAAGAASWISRSSRASSASSAASSSAAMAASSGSVSPLVISTFSSRWVCAFCRAAHESSKPLSWVCSRRVARARVGLVEQRGVGDGVIQFAETLGFLGDDRGEVHIRQNGKRKQTGTEIVRRHASSLHRSKQNGGSTPERAPTVGGKSEWKS